MGCVKACCEISRGMLNERMTQDKQTSLRLSDAAFARLDALRRAEVDLPTRAEMIRRLIDRASPSSKKSGSIPAGVPR